jgi:hypothetical protein
MKRVSSYNPRAPLPGIDSIWVWELDDPGACQLIKVTEVFWNGEEWWVRTVRLHDPLAGSLWASPTSAHLNDLSRFWEAVTPVRQTRTPRPPRTRRDGDQDGR